MELLDKYADPPVDFTDGLLMAMCERLGVKHILTVDADFAVYRFKGHGRFVNMFADQRKIRYIKGLPSPEFHGFPANDR